jgi:hypothetical protein
MLGHLMDLQSRHSEAVTYLGTCVQMIEKDPDLHLDNQGKYKYEQGEHREHLLSMEKGALLTLADIYAKAGQTDKAAAYKNQAATIVEPDFRV